MVLDSESLRHNSYDEKIAGAIKLLCNYKCVMGLGMAGILWTQEFRLCGCNYHTHPTCFNIRPTSSISGVFRNLQREGGKTRGSGGLPEPSDFLGPILKHSTG
jgi:hypothetical protein